MNSNEKRISRKLSGEIFTKSLEYDWDLVDFTRAYLNSNFKNELELELLNVDTEEVDMALVEKCIDELKLKAIVKTEDGYDKNDLFWVGEILQSWYIERYLTGKELNEILKDEDILELYEQSVWLYGCEPSYVYFDVLDISGEEAVKLNSELESKKEKEEERRKNARIKIKNPLCNKVGQNQPEKLTNVSNTNIELELKKDSSRDSFGFKDILDKVKGKIELSSQLIKPIRVHAESADSYLELSTKINRVYREVDDIRYYDIDVSSIFENVKTSDLKIERFHPLINNNELSQEFRSALYKNLELQELDEQLKFAKEKQERYIYRENKKKMIKVEI